MPSGTTLGAAYVQIVPSARGIKGSITEALGGEAESAGTRTGATIASKIKKAIVAAGIGAAVTKGLKAAFSEGAALEQSYLGGLDTLYGDAADQARTFARTAVTAGISMNSYAEQAVSFGAALKAAYGGDSTKAVKAANTAIMDMADNAAKMGTPLESVQAAYQGFAKGQYNLLDNLKIGYGGTKKEMLRLLADAQKLTGVKYDIDNLGDVYDAIHVIQGDLGLTGVAASEAATTFSGSFNAMKAAAQNLAGSLALGKGVEPALYNFRETFRTFFVNNFIPMLSTIIRGLIPIVVNLIKNGIPALVEKLGQFAASVTDALKTKADGVTSEKVKAWAITTIPKLTKVAGDLIGKFASGLLRNLPSIIKSVGRIAAEIVKGLGAAIWPKITEAATKIKDKFMAPIEKLKDKVKGIIDKIKGFFSFTVTLPKIKLPHFSISPKGWKLGDLLKGKIPSLGIQWYAKGGIATDPTLAGIGEAGPEAILPLKPFWKKMDQIVDATSENAGGITINVYGTPGMSVNELAAAVEQRLVRQTQNRRAAWAR